MATVFGSQFEKTATAGEKAVLKLLKQLGDDCIVYSQPRIGQGRADFVVILPEVGVFTVEVKDWIATSVKVENERILLNSDGEWRVTQHPLDQAKGYEKGLGDGLHGSKFLHNVAIETKASPVKFHFPIGCLVIFTKCNQADLDGRGLSELFPAKQVISRDDFETMTASGINLLYDALRNAYPEWRRFGAMSADQIAVVRSVISPSSVIDDGGLHLKILDLEQEKLARAAQGGHRVIYGPAGTGKTIILVARAKEIAKASEKHVLVICYNKLLSEWLRGQLAGYDNIEVHTFHSWGFQHGVSFQEFRGKSDYGTELLRELQGKADVNRYDAILIDEGQEFPKEWFECITLALKHDTDSDLFICGDGLQNPSNNKFTWKSIGISVTGGQRSRKLNLVYRCTKGIHETSLIPLRNRHGIIEEDVAFTDLERGISERLGPPPDLVRMRNRAEECRFAVSLVEGWLIGGFRGSGKRTKVVPSDIAILYPFRGTSLEPVFEELCTRLSTFCPFSVLTGEHRHGHITDGKLKLSTIQSSKGLQFRHVILLWTDLLARSKFDNVGGDANSWLHVGMTRAELTLTILHSQDWDALSEIDEHLHPVLS